MNIIKEGRPVFGRWHGEVRSIALQNYSREDLSDLWLRFRRKKWLYVGVYTQEFILGFALVDAAFVGNIFCYLYDKQTNRLWEVERLAPFAKGIRVEEGIHRSVCSYQGKNERIYVQTDLNRGIRHIDLRLNSDGRELDLRLELEESLHEHPPLQTLTPTAERDFTFTHKNTTIPVLGSVRLGSKRYELNPNKDSAVIDLSLGYPARETFWNWASATGRLKDGTWLGFNFVSPIHHDEFNENGLWVNGVLHKIAALSFEYDRKNTLAPWTIRSADGIVDLEFRPMGKREQSIDYRLMASQFQQPFGNFVGQIRLPSGECYSIDIPGVVEEHFARW